MSVKGPVNGASTTEAVATILPLPLAPSATFWDDTQWAIFWSLVEAAVPAITDESTFSDNNGQLKISSQEFTELYESLQSTVAKPPTKERFKSFLEYNAVKDPVFRETTLRTLSTIHENSQKAIGGAFSSMNSRLGSLLLTGYWSPPHQQPLHVRQAILKSWQVSRLKALRSLAALVTSLSLKSAHQASPAWAEATGWTDRPENHEPAKSYDFKFKQFTAASHPQVIETDVVIVGSGCGGAVCAKVLAEAGHRVLVVERAYHYPPEHLPMPQSQGCQYLFENGGVLGTDSGGMNVLAGSCWGGGGAINWSVSLQTQGYVRQEWAEEKGLVFFASNKFQESLDRVCDFMGVGTEGIVHNKRAQYLLDGSRKLGWHSGPAPQNTGGERHDCGRCHLGCPSQGKKGTAVSWLPAAGEAGAEFIEGFDVDKVLFDDASDLKRATGIRGKWTSRDPDGGVSGPQEQRITRDVIVRAKRVILSAGSLHSPLILMRSGFTNRHIGRNLKLHPTNTVMGVWKEEMKPWEGGIITALNHSFEDLDTKGHGTKIETTCMIPYLVMSQIVWRGGLEAKLDAINYSSSGAYISLTRERDSGRVYPDPITGRPHIDYDVSAFDAKHTLEGVIAIAKICYIEGAVRIYTTLPGVRVFDREPGAEDGVDDPKFSAWLDHVRAVGNAEATFASAHQMSSCRMGINEDEGVVDPKGRVFETEGLYVADASVLPSASGVNPMVTNMAIADWIAQGVSKDLKEEE